MYRTYKTNIGEKEKLITEKKREIVRYRANKSNYSMTPLLKFYFS